MPIQADGSNLDVSGSNSVYLFIFISILPFHGQMTTPKAAYKMDKYKVLIKTRTKKPILLKKTLKIEKFKT